MRYIKKRVNTILAYFLAFLMVLTFPAMVFATTDTNSGVVPSRTVQWVDKDAGIAQVKLTVDAKDIQTTVTTQKKTRVILVLDRSGSMEGSRMTELKSAAKKFVEDNLSIQGVEIGLVTYSSTAEVESNFTNDENALISNIDGISAGGGTNIQDGIKVARNLMSSQTADNKLIIVMSDGEANFSYKGTKAVSATSELNYNTGDFPYRITEFSSEIVGAGYSFDLPTVNNEEVTYVSHHLAQGENKTNYYKFENGSYVKIKMYENYPVGSTVYEKITKTTSITGYMIDTINITNNGYGTVSEAYLAKAEGNQLYSVGFSLPTDNAKKTMKSIASSSMAPYYQETAGDLNNLFEAISQEIQSQASGSGATVKDVIGSSNALDGQYNFEPIAGTEEVTAPAGVTGSDATYDASKREYSWILSGGDIKEGQYTFSYKIKLDLDNIGKTLQNVLTSNSTNLNYLDASGTAQTIAFPEGKLDITHYTIEYYFDGVLDQGKTENKGAIAGCSNITLTPKTFENYDYDKTVYGGDESNTGLAIDQDASKNSIKTYYKSNIGDISLHKKGLEKNEEGGITAVNVKGAKYEVFNSEEKAEEGIGAMEVIETDNEGLAKTTTKQYKVGETYYVKEKFAPAGYSLSDKIHSVKIEKGGLNELGEVLDSSTENVNVEKEWIDNPGFNGTHEDIALQLYRDGSPYGESKILTNGNTMLTFANLPVFNLDDEDVKEYKYTVKEVGVPAGYIKEENGLKVKNTAIKPVMALISGEKTLDGKILQSNEFNFKILDENDNVIGMASNIGQEIIFPPMIYNYDETGEYIYKIVEENGGTFNKGISYDGTIYYVKVTVTAKENGSLNEPEIEYYKNSIVEENQVSSLSFKNTYTATNATLNMDGYEKTEGKDSDNIKPFEFTLTSTDSNGEPLMDGDSNYYFEKVENNRNEGQGYDGVADFKLVTFKSAGTYYFLMKELEDTEHNCDFAKETFLIKVQVVDNQQGALVANVTEINHVPADNTDKCIFVNKYTGDEYSTVSANVEGSKIINAGKSKANIEFELTPVENVEGQFVEVPEAQVETVLTDSNGEFTFDLDYSEQNHSVGKTFYYRIEEKVDNPKDGYIYDTSEWIVKIQVSSNEETEKLEAEISTVSGDSQFENTYSALGTIDLDSYILVQGKNINTIRPFVFQMQEVSDVGTGTSQIKTNDNIGDVNGGYDGKIDFDPIVYDEEDIGIHTYVFSQIPDRSHPRCEFGKEVYLVKVNVQDNDDGTLTPIIVSVKEGEQEISTSANRIFINNYPTSNTLINAKAKQSLKGATLKANMFKYTLEELDENGNVKEGGLFLQTTNDALGTVDFGKIAFKEDDEGKIFNFKITQENLGLDGYTYDKATYIYKVQVVDKEGVLVAEIVNVAKDGQLYEGTEGLFVNTYQKDVTPSDNNNEPSTVVTKKAGVVTPVATESSPKTGDSHNLYSIAFLMTITAMGVILVIKLKKINK